MNQDINNELNNTDQSDLNNQDSIKQDTEEEIIEEVSEEKEEVIEEIKPIESVQEDSNDEVKPVEQNNQEEIKLVQEESKKESPQPQILGYDPQTGAPIYGLKEKPKKKHKGLIITLIIVLILGLLTGLYFLVGDKIFGEDSNSPSAITKKYVNNLVNKKYEDNFELIKLENNSYVVLNDYIAYVENNETYKDIEGNKEFTIKEITSTSTESTYEITFKKEEQDKNFSINLVKDEDKWKIKDGNNVTNWSFEIPIGTKVLIDGREVEQENITTNLDKNKEHSLCVIPEIAKVEKEITLEHNLGRSVIKVTPKDETDLFLAPEITNTELLYNAYNYIKDTWNSMYNDYVNKVSLETVTSKYFDSSVKTEDIKQIYTAAFDKITDATSTYPYHDMKVTEVVPSKKTQSTVYSEDIILVNFGYKLEYSYIWDIDYDMKRYSSIILKKDGESFKIYKITDIGLFNYQNMFTNDY